jgi:hypothetical protein
MPKYHNELGWPTLPAELEKQVLDLVHIAPNIWPTKAREGDYFQYEVPENIKEWCYTNLPISREYWIRIHRFTNHEADDIHIDQNRSDGYNYLVTPAGPTTEWYSDRFGTEVLENTVCKQSTWYWFDVSTMHTVRGMTEDRIAITTFLPKPWRNYSNNDFRVEAGLPKWGE